MRLPLDALRVSSPTKSNGILLAWQQATTGPHCGLSISSHSPPLVRCRPCAALYSAAGPRSAVPNPDPGGPVHPAVRGARSRSIDVWNEGSGGTESNEPGVRRVAREHRL